MNPPVINSNNSVTTSTKKKREAERSVNWTVEETQVLLCAWSDERVQKSLAENVRNRHVFKHLSARMCDLGFSRSPHQCRLRVKTLKANYVRAKLLKSVDDSQPCSFRYYAEMDAVLGRNRAVEGTGGGHFGSTEGIGGLGGCHFGSHEGIGGLGGCHFGSPEGIGGLGGHHFGSEGIVGTGHHFGSEGAGGLGGGRHFGSPGETGGRQSRYLVSEVKVEEEDREAEDTDEYEFNGVGIPPRSLTGPGGTRQDTFVERSDDYHEPVVDLLEDDLSSRSPSPPAPPPPHQPGSPVPLPVGSSPNTGSGTTLPSTHPQANPQSLEPALKHLADCFQRMVSESQGLLVQLESQRQEQDNMPQTPPLTGILVSGGYNKNLYQSQSPAEGQGYGSAGLYYHDNILVSGSMEALIHHLVPSLDYYPDRTYIFTFLLSSRLFIHPYALLSKVCHLCVEQQRLSDPQADKIRVRQLAPKVLQLLQEWTETFPYDFRDERMMRSLKELTHRLTSGDELYRKAVHQMTQVLIRKLTNLSQYEEALVKIKATATDRLTVLKAKPQAIQRDMLSICNDPFTVAQQLTHIELERLSYIGPEEFIQAFEKKDPLDNEKSYFSDHKKASNLEAYVEWFNRLSFMVATEICMPVKKKQRARVIEFFIDVARECFNIGNFNSLMAIISGMNMSPVSRLRKTWSKVKTAKFDILEHQMDPSSNFYNYRTALRGATQRSRTANSNREKIVIPFFSLLIKDIYFLNEGCSNKMQNGHVNFEKFWEMAKQVGEFMVWKKVECPFEKDRKILQYLLTAPVFSEDALYLASYESEGPENHTEKDRWKSLSLLKRLK
uniref:Ras-GEF domain-containing protein n=1 Tax=Esox lucius TaxID=8010 RepID=A0A6Q2YXM4_ESOLU